jgi:hypothetical protein
MRSFPRPTEVPRCEGVRHDPSVAARQHDGCDYLAVSAEAREIDPDGRAKCSTLLRLEPLSGGDAGVVVKDPDPALACVASATASETSLPLGVVELGG